MNKDDSIDPKNVQNNKNKNINKQNQIDDVEDKDNKSQNINIFEICKEEEFTF